ncbi:MAG: hypothetical protein U0Y10_23340 [Spirosomataceae bacterium]
MNPSLKIYRIVALILLSLTGINALIAGYLFIADPTGSKMGLSVTYLAHSPFESYLIPGLILVTVNGIFNVIVALMTLLRTPKYAVLIIGQGILLSGWILVQVLMVSDFNALHFTMLAIGLVLILCGWQLTKSPFSS